MSDAEVHESDHPRGLIRREPPREVNNRTYLPMDDDDRFSLRARRARTPR